MAGVLVYMGKHIMLPDNSQKVTKFSTQAQKNSILNVKSTYFDDENNMKILRND